MKNVLKKVALAFVFTLPALYVSAQSTTTGGVITLPQATPVAAVQAENTLAFLAEEPASEAITTNASAADAGRSEAVPARSMSEELAIWVEKKQAVVNSYKGLKRLK